MANEIVGGRTMPLSRLIYLSENRIDRADGSMLRQLGSIMATSQRNNAAAAITGALIFDDGWFLQVLEGDRRAVWRTFERIAADERHGGTLLVEMVDVSARLFGNWWMGLAVRSAATSSLFRPHERFGVFSPVEMSGRQVLDLMVGVAKLGLCREVAAEAA